MRFREWAKALLGCLSLCWMPGKSYSNPLNGYWKSAFFHPFYSQASMMSLDPYLLKMKIEDSSIVIKQFGAYHLGTAELWNYSGKVKLMSNVLWVSGKKCDQRGTRCEDFGVLQTALLKKDSLFLNWYFENAPFDKSKPMVLLKSSAVEFNKPDSLWISE